MRLIDAEAFLKTEIDRCGSAPLVGTCTSDNQYLSDRLKKAPTIEAKPVVHGRWELEHETYGKMRCSVCKKEALIEKTIGEVGVITIYVDSNYCPNCGAMMDEKENDK